MNAPNALANQDQIDKLLEEDNDLSINFQQSEQQKDFSRKQRQAILNEESDALGAGKVTKASSLQLLKKARYKPGVQFLQ